MRAWGHGPLDASLEFDGNDIVYTVPGVGTDEYAEARVTFPVSWLTGMVPSSISRLPNIRAEEQQWADEANARREQARRTIAVCTVLGAGAVAGIVVLTVLFKLRYARKHKARFSDPYFRDVPSADHPAVLAALWEGGKVPGEAFTATLMKLTDDGVIGPVARQGREGPREGLPDRAREPHATDDIDDAAMRLMFDVVAPEGQRPALARGSCRRLYHAALLGREARRQEGAPDLLRGAWRVEQRGERPL